MKLLPSRRVLCTPYNHRSQETVSLPTVLHWCTNGTRFVTGNSDYIRHFFYNHPRCLCQHKYKLWDGTSLSPEAGVPCAYIHTSELCCFHSLISIQTLFAGLWQHWWTDVWRQGVSFQRHNQLWQIHHLKNKQKQTNKKNKKQKKRLLFLNTQLWDTKTKFNTQSTFK